MRISKALVILTLFFIGHVNTVVSEEQKKVFVVLREDSEAQLEAALDHVEIKLTYAELSGDTEIRYEVYAFHSAVNLFTIQKSPLGERLEQIFSEYPSLKVFACDATKNQFFTQVQLLDSCKQQIDERRKGEWFEFEVHEADEG